MSENPVEMSNFAASGVPGGNLPPFRGSTDPSASSNRRNIAPSLFRKPGRWRLLGDGFASPLEALPTARFQHAKSRGLFSPWRLQMATINGENGSQWNGCFQKTFTGGKAKRFPRVPRKREQALRTTPCPDASPLMDSNSAMPTEVERLRGSDFSVDGNEVAVIPARRREFLPEAPGLGTEDEKHPPLCFHLPEGAGPVFREERHLFRLRRLGFKKLREGFPDEQLYLGPVVEACPLHLLFVEGESEGLDQVEGGIGADAGAADVPVFQWISGMDQYDVPFRGRWHRTSENGVSRLPAPCAGTLRGVPHSRTPGQGDCERNIDPLSSQPERWGSVPRCPLFPGELP